MKKSQKNSIRVALVVPHIFLHRNILPNVIFAPGNLALNLAEGLTDIGVDVTLFTPGPANTNLPNVTADLSYFDSELNIRGDDYIDLLKKHPFVFVTLARQVQAELIAKAYISANNGEFDIVHIFTNEEDIALPFSKLCDKPVVFTHHDPFNFLVRYKNNFPKYHDLNWISLSLAQRRGMPNDTNWVANVHNGLNDDAFTPISKPTSDYIAYFGRIIQPKGVILAINAVKRYNETANKPIKLLIAGKHYTGSGKDTYWTETIEPQLDGMIQYVGFIKDSKRKNEFLGNAKALMIPSLFEEPFGMVMIESLASGTPIIGLDSGAIPEIINAKNGILVNKAQTEDETVTGLAKAIDQIDKISRSDCRDDFIDKYTMKHMCEKHANLYKKLSK